MLKCARKASLKGVSGFIWRRLQAAPLFSKYAKSDIKESAGRKMAALRRERSENEAKIEIAQEELCSTSQHSTRGVL